MDSFMNGQIYEWINLRVNALWKGKVTHKGNEKKVFIINDFKIFKPKK